MAFYDGRIEHKRLYGEEENWLDDGAFILGTATYAIFEGAEAVVYDTHMTLDHAAVIRATLEKQGVTSIRVVMSHWHTDHVAGNAVFSDCEIISCDLTRQRLIEHREELENGSPPIKPLVLPTTTFTDRLDLTVGSITLELRQIDIHSADGTLVLIPSLGLVLAGDTLEDTLTYVTEPGRLAIHLRELARFRRWDFQWILPNHGRYEMIAAGGYQRDLIAATERYLEQLIRLAGQPELADLPLVEFAAGSLATGAVAWFAPYEEVHRHNIRCVLKAAGEKPAPAP
ncbi:MBL fold metallo-hydrolase [Enterobacteriales bacterium SAP-6]|uniref:MBL fold metallo-hydrolase n=2 Tax=Acerihabitans arboris TaxID=2691583 RepID=A0A845SHL7_9GAMM|nr:MBL fold metallo-hydrolase [Acerihabitans arboris]